MKPLIGVPLDLIHDIDAIMSGGLPDMMIADTPMETIDAIRAGGGIALGLPLAHTAEEAEEACMQIDGLVVPVGDDLAPCTSHVPLGKYSGKFRIFKDESDIYYIQAMIKLGKPVLGLCRGMQLISCSLGGDMTEHIPLISDGTVVHSSPVVPTDLTIHTVSIEAGSALAKAMGVTSVAVNSFHHMSLKNLGRGLHCVATADDGIVEAVENEDGTVIGVQWHPECLFKEHAEQLRLFEAFVALTAKNSGK